MRVGFIGASGTGKSTLVRFLQSKYPGVPVNPVGSRSVAKAMGFVHPEGSPQAGEGNPYAVDRASVSTYERNLAILGNLNPVDHPAAFPPGTTCVEAMAIVARDAAVEAMFAWENVAVRGPTCRPIFQVRLQFEKIRWEESHDAFFTDRTPLDDLAYAILHCREVVDDAFIDRAFTAMARYDAIFYCPVATFCNLDGDASRVADRAYHRVHDALLAGLIRQYEDTQCGLDGRMLVVPLSEPVLSDRQEIVSWHVSL